MGSNNQAIQTNARNDIFDPEEQKQREAGGTIKNADLYNQQYQDIAKAAGTQKQAADVGTNQLVNRLTGQATGTAPSLADLQLKAANDRNLAQQVAAAAAARGGSPAAAQRLAMMNAGANFRNAANQGAQARLQEGMAANQELGSVLGNEQNTQGQQQLAATSGGFGVNQAVTNAAEQNFRDVANATNAIKETQNKDKAANAQQGNGGGLGAIAGGIGSVGKIFGISDKNAKIKIKGSYSDEDTKDNVKKSDDDDDFNLDKNNTPKPSFLEAVSKLGTAVGGGPNKDIESLGNNLGGIVDYIKQAPNRQYEADIRAGKYDNELTPAPVAPIVTPPVQLMAGSPSPTLPTAMFRSDQQAKWRIFKEDISNPIKAKMSFLQELMRRDADPESGMELDGSLSSDVNMKELINRIDNNDSGMHLDSGIIDKKPVYNNGPMEKELEERDSSPESGMMLESDEDFKSEILKTHYTKNKPVRMSYSDEDSKDQVTRKPASVPQVDPEKYKKYGFESEFQGKPDIEKIKDWAKNNLPSDKKSKYGLSKEYSDKETKNNMSEPEHKVHKFLDAIKPATYNYKPEYQQKPNDKGEQVGIIAQDIEKGGPAGKNMVVKGPDNMKMIDTVKGFGSVLAALGDLHSRLKEIESKKGKKD